MRELRDELAARRRAREQAQPPGVDAPRGWRPVPALALPAAALAVLAALYF